MKRFIIILFILTLNIFFTSVSLADEVIYNTKTGKIHVAGCQWAKKCTVNCVKLERKEAIKRGGVPCKVCGGK